MDRPLVPARACRFAEDSHVFLKGSDEVGKDLKGHGDFRPYGRADDVIGLCLLDVALREREDFAEGQGEIKRGMRDRAEIRVDPRGIALVVGNDGEVDLLAFIHIG
jgi:hypothetical protein